MKTRMGTQVVIGDKKTTTTSKNTETEHENIFGQIGKSTATRTKNTTRRDSSESIGERRKTKNIPRQDQTISTKQDIPKQRKKILPASKGRMDENIPATGCEGKKKKDFRAKYGNGKIMIKKSNG